MQYGVASVPRSNAATEPKLDVDSSDTTIAGRWLYQRSQTLLACELENPSNTTLQCYIFSIYYLCSASFQNMAYSTLALAVRTAHILGLHLEPSADMPRNQRELRKRLWWTLYTLESKTYISLDGHGRPTYLKCPAVYQLTIKSWPCSQALIVPLPKTLPGILIVYRTRSLSWRLVRSISLFWTSVQIFLTQKMGQHFTAVLKPSKTVLSSSCRV